MKKMFLLSSACVLILAACNSTKVTSSYKTDNAVRTASRFNKIAVAALLPAQERTLQPAIESELVKSLQDKGINAVSAYQSFGPNAMTANEKAALKMLKKNGADAVLTVVLLNKDKEKNYTPGSVDYQPYGFFYGGRFRGYYGTLYNRVYTPGYYTTSSNYFWESNLYDLKTGKLLYSVQSETFDPSSTQNLASGYSKKVVDDMQKQGLVGK